MPRSSSLRTFLRLAPTVVAGLLAIAGAAVLVVALLPASAHHGRSATGLIPRPGGRRCVYAEETLTGLAHFERVTGSPVQCVELFNTDAADWTTWTHPFFVPPSSADAAWSSWVRARPGRRLTITQPLIPNSIDHADWLAAGAAGDYESYARAFARNLVVAGLGHSIIRLAPEANGTWETYSLPTSATGLAQWRSFWRRTVLAMRSVKGAAFQFDWTVNALERPVPLRSFYPGNDVVDIIGIDAYEQQASSAYWHQLLIGTDGLRAVAAFARSSGKPLSLPEWGMTAAPDPATRQYFDGIARFLAANRVAYEAYFFAHGYATTLAPESAALEAFRAGFAGG